MKTGKIIGHWGRWGASAPSIQNLPKDAKLVPDELQIDKEAFEDAQALARMALTQRRIDPLWADAYWHAAMKALKEAYSTKS